MKGNVCGHYLAIKPDVVETEDKSIEGGVLDGFVIEQAPEDANHRARIDASATTGEVIAVGNMCWKAYDGNDPPHL